MTFAAPEPKTESGLRDAERHPHLPGPSSFALPMPSASRFVLLENLWRTLAEFVETITSVARREFLPLKNRRHDAKP